MADDTTASTEAGGSVPESLAKQIASAAERGDRMAFTAAAARLGSIAAAQALVRERGIVRMVDRAVIRRATPALVPVLRAVETRADDADDTDPVMFGHFAVFNEWTEIDSWFEGHFLERIAPNAFKKTFREHRSEIKPLFQHGYDPVVGDKPLGPVDELREDETGAYYEVPLLDASYVRNDVLPGLREGLYGASFAFKTMREEFVEEPDPSDANPVGLPERTLKELRVYEFSPVTFPAYPSATAGVKPADSESEAERTTPPAEGAETKQHPDPEPVGAAPSSHPDLGRRGQSTYSLNRKEAPRWRLP